jgi:hypothetical protein
MSMRVCSRRFADPQHGPKCGFQRFMNKQTEHAEGNDNKKEARELRLWLAQVVHRTERRLGY